MSLSSRRRSHSRQGVARDCWEITGWIELTVQQSVAIYCGIEIRGNIRAPRDSTAKSTSRHDRFRTALEVSRALKKHSKAWSVFSKARARVPERSQSDKIFKRALKREVIYIRFVGHEVGTRLGDNSLESFNIHIVRGISRIRSHVIK